MRKKGRKGRDNMREGREKLLEVLTRTKVEYLAKRCFVTSNAVYNWRAGRNAPGSRARAVLELCYGIEGIDWEGKR